MNDLSRFETRVAELVADYADRAPTDVDPLAMTRLVVADARGPLRPRLGSSIRVLALAAVVTSMLATILGGLLSSGGPGPSESSRTRTERPVVEPFDGLPPEGTAPSTPATGELVVMFAGRLPQPGFDPVRFIRVYADGRLISGVETTGTYRVEEQYLAPEGVELMRSAAVANTALRPDRSLQEDVGPDGPGADWGAMRVQLGGQRFRVAWSDATLPARMVDPGSWLPGHAWWDRRAMPYVASRYAVCVDAGAGSTEAAFELLPGAVRGLVRSKGDLTPDVDDDRCLYEVTTADARMIAAAAEMTMTASGTVLAWTSMPRPAGWIITLELLRVLPDGAAVCNCG